jgi:hypothetical protein
LKNSFRSGIVGGRDQPEIAEAGAQCPQQPAGCRQGVARIECIGETELLGDIGHELRNAHGADPADGHVIEAALAPDQIGEESDREIVGLRNRDKARADLLVRQRRRIRFLERGPGALQ